MVKKMIVIRDKKGKDDAMDDMLAYQD